MAKNPVFPLYYNDIDRSTKTWTDEEFGAYVRLLMEQWDKGFLPKDYQRLTRIATSLDTNWPTLKNKFTEVDGVLKNLRLEEIREEKARHSQKQKENVEKRYSKLPKDYQTNYQKSTKNIPLEGDIEGEWEYKLKGVENDFSKPDIEGDEIHFPVDTQTIRGAWSRWKEYRLKTHNRKYQIFGEQSALKLLEGKSEQEILNTIFKAIESNWLNLYPDKSKQNGTGTKKGLDINTELDLIANHIKSGQR